MSRTNLHSVKRDAVRERVLLAIGFFFSGILSLAVGCQTAAGPGVMLVGRVVNDADIKSREYELMGRGAHAADDALGPRLESLRDNLDPNRRLLIYSDAISLFRYVVELSDGRIVAISKGVENAGGVEDVIKSSKLRERLIGFSAAEAEAKGDLGRPVAGFQSEDSGEIVMVYDVRKRSNLRGARYCILRFAENKCSSVKLVGIDSTTKANPARK